jgi:4-amino-4-deoxy-L-arabinose transferase-like glycosyltransferase
VKGITGGNPLTPPRGAWAIAVVTVAAHVLVAGVGPYELHRDEFLYLAMGARLGQAPLDFPPFIAALAAAVRALLGDATWAIRLPSALAHGAMILLTASLARQFSASRAAAALAAFAVAVAPVYLRAGSLFQPVVFDQLWWTVALYALLTLHVRDDPRRWVLVGGVMGVGLLTKFSIVFVGAGVFVATLAGHRRADLATRWPWLGLAAALAIGAPSLWAQAALEWPIAYQMAGLRAGQLDRLSPFDFVLGQPLLLGPAIVLAAVGAWWMVAGPPREWGRDAAVACLVALGLLALAKGKPYYGAPVYPVLIAAGCAALSQLGAAMRRRLALGGAALATAAFGVVAVPMGLPFLPPARMAAFAAAIGVGAATESNTGAQLALPQDYADMRGWRAQVAHVAEVWKLIPDSSKGTAVLLATNYGRAGALEHHGARLGLPRPVSAAGSYWFFGPGDRRGPWVVSVGPDDAAAITPYFEWCDWYTHVAERWVVPEERLVKVWLCFGPFTPLDELWPRFDPRGVGR